MKPIFVSIYIIFIIFFLISCEGSLDDEKRVSNEAEIERFLSTNKLEYTKQNGVYYATRLKGYGYEVSPSDTISFWYKAYTLKGNVFDTNIPVVANEYGFDLTAKDYTPIETVAGSNDFLEGVNRGLLLCREGEWGTILFPSTYGFNDNIVQSIPAWTALAYDIFIINVKNQEIEQEQNNISNFVASSSGYTQDTTGLWYKYIIQNEQSILPSLGDTIYGWYKGQILSGSTFDETTLEGEELVINFDQMTEGLLYSFLKMYPGEEMHVIVPSSLGFGVEGNDQIDPYSTLIYELRLDSIK